MAILVGKGTEGHDVMSLAKRILKILDSDDERANLKELQKIKGVGPAKSMLIATALEFARRRIRPEGLKISFPADVLPLIRHYADQKQEHFICILLMTPMKLSQAGLFPLVSSTKHRFTPERSLPILLPSHHCSP
jgi:DNA repair protein RadC